MMTLNKARSLALASLAMRTDRPREEVVLLDELTQCRRVGWIFFSEPIGVTRPVVVTHGGQVHHLEGERPAEEMLRDLEKSQRRPPIVH